MVYHLPDTPLAKFSRWATALGVTVVTPETAQKLELYRRLARARTAGDLAAFRQEELAERFEVNRHTLRRALDCRPFGYLVKPCEARELHATIQMALARREVDTALT